MPGPYNTPDNSIAPNIAPAMSFYGTHVSELYAHTALSVGPNVAPATSSTAPYIPPSPSKPQPKTRRKTAPQDDTTIDDLFGEE